MPSVYSAPLMVPLELPGALTVGLTTKRLVVPFGFEMVGATVTVNTAPTGANLIFDVLAGPNNSSGMTSAANTVYKTAANRPTILAGNFDQAGVSAPFNPAIALDTAVEPSELSFFAKPDPSSLSTFAGNQPVNTTQGPVAVNAVESPTQNQPQAQANRGYRGAAGTVLQLAVVQVGSTVAGSDAVVLLTLLQI